MSYAVLSSEPVFTGRVISVRSDVVEMPGGGSSQRDVVEHPGAVAVVALRTRSAGPEVLLVTQYRHPVRGPLEELPAGLLDVAGEPARVAAARELAEETGMRAGRLEVLADVLTSPGMTDEAVRVFLAHDVEPIPGHQHLGTDEEAEIEHRWVALGDAVADVLAGRLQNSLAVIGVLAALAVQSGAGPLRAADAAWDRRPALGG